MSKYDPLRLWLKKQREPEVSVHFLKIEEILNDVLPSSAYKHRPWWANESIPGSRHVQLHSWMNAGRRVKSVDLSRQLVIFEKR